MAIRRYLAMTAGEFRENREISWEIGYLSCHFSSYSRGLSNLPQWLKPRSLLILDDRTPIQGHDPEQIGQELADCIQALDCAALLLDFQREGCDEARELARALTGALPCPVAVSALYADQLDCPVCLPPAAPSVLLGDHVRPWQGRELWLELALEAQEIRLTEAGARVIPLEEIPEDGLVSKELHCRYRVEVTSDAAVFSLWRTRQELDALLEEGEALGVTTAVGLYQELGDL